MGDIEALVAYYLREGHFRHVQAVCEEVAGKRGWDGQLLFWRSVGLGQEGSVNEAIRELEDVRKKRDFEFAASEALLVFHRRVKLRDDAAIAELERGRAQVEDRASDASALLAAAFLLHAKDYARARRAVDRVLEKNPMSIKACTLKGWVEALSACNDDKARRDSSRSSASQLFDQALNADRSGKKEVNALMGMAYQLLSAGKHTESLEYLDKAIVSYQWFLPALVEKAKTLLLMRKWDLALETAERVLHQDANDIGSLMVVVFCRLAHEADAGDTLGALERLSGVLERFEPSNPELWMRAARPIARLAERNVAILKHSLRLVDRAKRAAPDNAEYATEYAYQLSLQGKIDAAFSAYENAAQLDESNGTALFGQIYCLVMRGDLDEAEQQLEFLSVLQETIGRTAQVAFLEAKLAWLKTQDLRAAMKLLNETVHLHVRAIQSKRHVCIFEHHVVFNPDFMLEIANEYLQHCGSEPIELSEATPQYLSNGIKLLEKVLKFVPCMPSAQLALARARLVGNELDLAVKTVQQALEMDPNLALGHVMLAQIQLCRDDFQGAKSSLEQAMSLDFSVKDSPSYMIIKARVLLATGDLDEALALLQRALRLPGVCSVDPYDGSESKPERRGSRRTSTASGSGDASGVIGVQERASIFVNLAQAHIALKETDKARAVIHAGRRELKGTSEEVRIVVADAEIALKRNDVKGALRMLNEVGPDSPAYSKAHAVKAGIYLNHRNDKDAYIRCFIELVEHSPSAHSHLLLGEAYMRASMPDDAIEAFKEALKRNPKDSMLAKRIGKVLVSTHDYTRAIDYYKSALRSAESGRGRHELRYDLAELYFNLGKHAKADKELQSAMTEFDFEGDGESKGDFSRKQASIDDMVGQVRALKLLARVREGEGEDDKVTETLAEARSVQGRIIAACRGTVSSEGTQKHKQEMAQICILLASHLEKAKEQSQAVALYNEALRHDSGHVASMLALARLHFRAGDLERCHNQCVTILRVDEHNSEAGMMLADIMFQRNDFKMAIHHHQQLLERNPTSYPALAKLVMLLFRAGELDRAERFFKLAEHKSPRAAHDAGFGYCKGLYHRHLNDINQAITEFNKARRDAVWGERALTQMIEIYLNPDNANLWEDEGSVTDSSAGVNLDAVRTAQKLLEEMPDKGSTNCRLLECYAIMATRNRPDVEKAFQRLVEIVQEDQDHVPSLLALSTALMMMKQTPKARNQLKRISKMTYNQEQAEAFEKCWLLLADIFIGSGKYDLAQGLCKRCLQYNRSCAKAWEYMGMIMEKEAAYADAAEHYEQAWKFQKMASASVGYKLAFNYLKARRHVEAINVANNVLKQFPEYPKIRKDILEKARASIRA